MSLAINLWLPASGEPLPVLSRMALLASVYVGLILLFGLEPEDRSILARMRKRASRKLPHL